MVLNFKTRLVLAGAVLGSSLLTLAAEPQIDTSNGVTVTPGATQPAPPPSPPDPGTTRGVGGSGPASSSTTDGGVGDAGF